MVDRLKAMGLVSEIIAWKLRLFVPTGVNGPAILGALMERYPLFRVADRVRRKTAAHCYRKPPNWRTVSRAMSEAVCRHYLSNGRREGRYWLVGDVRNTPGRSLFVRLKGPESGKGAAGNGPMRRPATTVISSTSSAKAVALSTSTTLPTKPGAFSPCQDRSRSQTKGAPIFRTVRIAGVGTASFRHVADDFGHGRRSVFAQTRHLRLARNRKSPIPPTLLLPAR